MHLGSRVPAEMTSARLEKLVYTVLQLCGRDLGRSAPGVRAVSAAPAPSGVIRDPSSSPGIGANRTPVNSTALLESAHSACPPPPVRQLIRPHVSALRSSHEGGYHADLAVRVLSALTVSYFGVLGGNPLSCGLAVDVVHSF